MVRRFPSLTLGLLLLAAAPLRADDAEDRAVKAVEKLGGKVVRDNKDSTGPAFEVDLSDTAVTDAALRELPPLKELKKLAINSCLGVTDAGVAELRKALPDCKTNR